VAPTRYLAATSHDFLLEDGWGCHGTHPSFPKSSLCFFPGWAPLRPHTIRLSKFLSYLMRPHPSTSFIPCSFDCPRVAHPPEVAVIDEITKDSGTPPPVNECFLEVFCGRMNVSWSFILKKKKKKNSLILNFINISINYYVFYPRILQYTYTSTSNCFFFFFFLFFLVHDLDRSDIRSSKGTIKIIDEFHRCNMLLLIK
jgi:hypothetical protein